jgi:cell division protein FtsL
VAEGGLMKSQGTLRLALAFAALFGSLSLVVWRQSRALEALRELDAARAERAMLESQRTTLSRKIQELEGRARIVAVAGARLGMHPAEASELVILQLPPAPAAEVHRGARLALAGELQ